MGLSSSQQNAINRYQDLWKSASTEEEKRQWHEAAERVRNSAGFSGGADGSQVIYNNNYYGSTSYAPTRFDSEMLSPDDYARVRQYQQNWQNATTDQERDGWHRMAESVRRKSGYSGGMAGNEYIHVPTFNPPKIPEIPEYNSRYEGQLHNIVNDLNNQDPYSSPYADRINATLDKLQNRPEYVSPYADMIKTTLDKIMNRPDFKYDPEKDPAFMALRKQAQRQGEQNYENAIGGISANTGGRLNTWATSMASQGRNNALLQAEMAQPQYEQRAYERYQYESMQNYNQLSALQNLDGMEFNKYQASYNNQLNMLSALQNLDSTAYMQYRDRIQDKRELANFVMALDDRDYKKYQFMVENQWQQYSAEYSNFQNELQFQRDEWQRAMDRTNLNGYVNNQDSYILGVRTGTLSQEARKRQDQINDFFLQADYSLSNEYKKMELNYSYETELSKLRQSGDLSIINMQGDRGLSRLGSAVGGSVVQNALGMKGAKYVWGGNKPTATDCSGMVMQAYKQAGYDLGNKRLTTAELRSDPKQYGFKEIPIKQAKPGDVMWVKGHMAMLYDNDNVIEASQSKGKTVIQTAWNRNKPFTKAYRYVGR